MSTSKDFTVAIIGGGIAGLTLGIALHERGIPVHLYEQAHHFGEIGAGVSFSANAIDAMHVCHGGVHAAFARVATHNAWPSKSTVWFDYYDGMKSGASPEGSQKLFSITTPVGQNGLHRADFLDELVKLFPAERAHFGKHFDEVSEGTGGKLVLKFADGTSADADAVVGCDGIHSRVRRMILGSDHPSVEPTYTHKYAYRGAVPMEEAVEAIGEEKAKNAALYLGKEGHVLTFAMKGGAQMNIVAFHDDPEPWTDTVHLTKWSTRDAALKDFKDFGPDVKKILGLTPAELNVWAIFDMGNSLPTFTKGRLVVTGDAAHATSPHHGSGAGFAIEDSAVLAELLADERVKTPKDIEAAFSAFNDVRLERDHWLVKSSRFVGDCVEGMNQDIGMDWEKFHQEMVQRYDVVMGIDISKQAQLAKDDLYKRLA
ncbi:salicylate 1-monooxygenase sala [Mycena haematopus]|nr:salicylate 1-monooxygenase sala [Mycena haematopus]